MSKKKSITTPVMTKNIEKDIMSQIRTGQINMKPRWLFVVGSILMLVGLVSLSLIAIFCLNIVIFSFRRHGQINHWRLQMMFSLFPWWAPIIALIGIIGGVWFLKQYDFSYKKNFLLIVISFVMAILISAFLIDFSGMNELWAQRGPMKRMYHRLEKRQMNLKDKQIPNQQYYFQNRSL